MRWLRNSILPFLLFIVAAVPVPAHAASRANRTGRGLLAVWSVPDGYGTSVQLNGGYGREQFPPGSPTDFRSAEAWISQAFCDVSTDTFVVRDWLGIGGADITIDATLDEGRLASNLILSGNEYRMPNCAEPDGEQMTVSTLEPGGFSFQVHLVAAGDPVQDNWYVHDVAPGNERVLSHMHGRSRVASALFTGFYSVPDTPPMYWTLETAVIYDYVRMEQTVGWCPGGGEWPRCNTA